MPDVSPKMRKGVKVCEEILGIKCEGKDFDTVKKFLDENLPKIKDADIRDYRKPSDKMLNAIAIIEQKTGRSFSGHTMKEASAFISENYEAAFGKSYSKSKGGRRK